MRSIRLHAVKVPPKTPYRKGDFVFSYRDLKKEDLDVIAAFPENRAESFYMYPKGTFPLNPLQLFEVSKTRYLPTVIEYDKEIVGYSNLYIEEDHYWLGNVIISSKFRGRGAGRYLVNALLERAKNELQAKELRLVCHNVNTKALLLYNKLGFKPYEIKCVTDFDNNEIAGIKMTKSI
ncbi:MULTISPECIES: GNAT family N-acetyltransferase [unclassified Paenibacillus]|uniref:GNAT family N-acetyltransferase n=1 Tax=unclassified Paenibacillus TaxID=185978 RepID=UPI00363DD1DD